MRTFIYVDGFNLYYGCCKGRPYKWLNPSLLCKHLLQEQNHVEKIKYFSAEMKPRADDPDCLNSQRTFFRALKTISNLEIKLGKFLENEAHMLLADPTTKPRVVKVLKIEEKGSDVNIATQMLVDAFDDRFDCAVLISNDSDLARPIEIIKQRFNKVVGVLNPQKNQSVALKTVVDFYKPIRKGVLKISQFPETLADMEGTFHKPSSW